MQKNIRLYLLLCVSFILAFSACSQKTHDLEAALASLNTDELAADVKVLASDEYEGRFPASPGEEKTIEYLRAEFEKVGLKRPI